MCRGGYCTANIFLIHYLNRIYIYHATSVVLLMHSFIKYYCFVPVPELQIGEGW